MESRPYKHVLHLEEEGEEEDNYNGMMGAFSDPREEAVEKMRMSFTFSSYHYPVVILPRGEGNGEVNSPTGEGCDDASSACNDEQLLQLRYVHHSSSFICIHLSPPSILSILGETWKKTFFGPFQELENKKNLVEVISELIPLSVFIMPKHAPNFFGQLGHTLCSINPSVSNSIHTMFQIWVNHRYLTCLR